MQCLHVSVAAFHNAWLGISLHCSAVVFSCCCWPLQEVRRAGDHTTPRDALQLLLWHLHGALLAALQQLLQASTSSSSNGNIRPGSAGPGSRARSLSEKGVLQLLFDQRFMRDVLGGGKPLAAVSTAAVTAVGSSSGASATANGGVSSISISADADVAARKRLVSGLEQQLQVGDCCDTVRAGWGCEHIVHEPRQVACTDMWTEIG